MFEADWPETVVSRIKTQLCVRSHYQMHHGGVISVDT